MFELLGQRVCATVALVAAMVTSGWAQGVGTVNGTVTLTETGAPVHGVVVLIEGPALVALTDERGRFEIRDVPPGTYQVLAQREHLTAGRQTVTVTAGQATTVDFQLRLLPFHEEVTVTATVGGPVAAFDAFNATTTLDSFELVSNAQGTLGEALEREPGIAKRSFGPGTSRPIIRGFDGDRVLVMEDGIRTGDLSAQSGDHGVTIDPNGLERVEIVRGPATLLYGSNAVGGVINTITPHEDHRRSPITGTRGQFSSDAGSANGQAGINASVQHARNQMLFWAGGGARRTADYDTPAGSIENSATRLSTGRAGIGYLGDRLFASGGFTLEDGRYGVPFASAFSEEGDFLVDLDTQRRVGRFDVGVRNLGNPILDSAQLVFNVIDWEHDELEVANGTETVGTSFDNRTYVVRADLTQRQVNRLSGRFGVESQFRDYVTVGEEALAPPTDQTTVAAFAYEELAFGRYRIQFGGRVERNAYTPGMRARGGRDEEGGEDPDLPEPPPVRDREFTGVSASFGFRADLGASTALVANVTRSSRAPALEELYNFGPHVGNLAFEIGNPNLGTEATVGLDLSLRHRSDRFRGNFNVYIYDISDFVFLDIDPGRIVANLRVADYLQGDSRFVGFEAKASARVGEVWATLGLGLVDAELTSTNESLPRIPPLRGQLSVDIPYRGLTVTPEWVFATRQDDVFRDETVTPGYSIVNLTASYMWTGGHAAHVVSVTGFNLTNKLYLNHTSFIKDLAPEIGRGVKVSYSLRFF